MKKLLTVVLLCAMLFTALVPCATAEQAGAYNNAHESNFKTELTNADVWDGKTPDATAADAWYAELADNKITIDSAADLACFAVKLNAGTSFADVTVNLEKDIDLGGKEWIQISTATANYFKGTFNGNNHAIGNFKMTLTKKGNNGWGFFGALTDNAKIMNLSLINGTVINNNQSTSDKIGSVGVLIGDISPTTGNTVRVSNVYSNVNIATATDTVKGRLYYSGGLIGNVKGSDNPGDLVLENVKFEGDIANTFVDSSNPDCMGGLIGRVQKAGNLTISNCYVDSDINISKGGTVGGVIALVDQNQLTSLAIENCNVKVNLTCAGNSGGLIGKIDKAPKTSFTINNCTVTGELNVGNFSGGFVGAVNAAIPLTMTGCIFNGTLTAKRVSGGFFGKLMVSGTDNIIANCSIGKDAILNISTNEGSAGEMGGFIGRLASAGTLTITNPKMLGTLNATFASTASSGNEYAAALIGKVDAQNTVVNVIEPIITGNLSFVNNNTTSVVETIAILCAGVKDNTVQFNYTTSPVWYDPASVSVPDGMTLYLCGFTANPSQNTVVGYQTRANGETAYDLRYVVALNLEYETDYDYVGIEVTINYKNAAQPKTFTAYVEKLYTSVDGDGNTYTAQSLGGKYLYTVVIEGIPNDFNVEDATMQVTLKPFTVKGTGESAVTTVGATATHGSVATAE